jgi:hypothetical protein
MLRHLNKIILVSNVEVILFLKCLNIFLTKYTTQTLLLCGQKNFGESNSKSKLLNPKVPFFRE